MQNPFEFGRELDPAELVDREEEVAEVVRTIESGGKLFLVEPRRYGKTSILRAAEQRLEAAGAVALRFDAEAYATLELLVRAIFLEAGQRLHGNLAQTRSSLGKFFSRLKPELSVNLVERPGSSPPFSLPARKPVNSMAWAENRRAGNFRDSPLGDQTISGSLGLQAAEESGPVEK